jgi:hypothetical protein
MAACVACDVAAAPAGDGNVASAALTDAALLPAGSAASIAENGSAAASAPDAFDFPDASAR